MAPAEPLRVEVVYCASAGQVDLQSLTLPAGATLAEALAASGLALRHGLELATLRFGIWGKARDSATVLRDHDRIEVYRHLTVDPKEARRQRYQRHRERQGQPAPVRA